MIPKKQGTQQGTLPGCKGSKGGLFLIVGVVAEHTVLPEEAVHTTFSVNNFLGPGVERMVARPNFDVDFRLGGADGHDDFTVTDYFGIWVPFGVNISFRHRNYSLADLVYEMY